MIGFAAMLTVALVTVAAQAPGQVDGRAPLTSPGGCQATRVTYGPSPRPPAGIHTIPWLALRTAGSTRITGYLFYYGTTWFKKVHPAKALIKIRGGTSVQSMKILWVVEAASRSDRITVRGRRQGRNASFVQVFPSVGGGQFPSIVDVPAVGCWRVTVSAGDLRGTAIFKAIR